MITFSCFAESQMIEVKPISNEEIIEIEKTKSLNKLDQLTLNSLKEVFQSELIKQNVNSEKIWTKINAKATTPQELLLLLKPIVKNQVFLAPKNREKNPEIINKMFFQYDLNEDVIKNLIIQYSNDYPDFSVKTFFIFADINIDKNLTWNDVGVSKKENFADVIVSSWQKWAQVQFKSYPNIVILERDLNEVPKELLSTMHRDSVLLKWNSLVKRSQLFNDRLSAEFEISARYQLVQLQSHSNQIAFDFPTQKKEFALSNPKNLSSSIASLTYNLLNSQTQKIQSALELIANSKTQFSYSFAIKGDHGLFDITLINNFLINRFSDISLTAELLSYESKESKIGIKSSLDESLFIERILKEGSQFPLNEQKILIFKSDSRSFAILPKDANN